MTKTAIGEELRLRRELARLFQWQVAREVGLSNIQLSLIENGRKIPTPELAEKIRNAIDILKSRKE